jgi:murein L,D-transpeptidase YafK
VWVQNVENEPYQLLKTYPICDMSGMLGPKRQQGDKQVPEGFYTITEFNPNSRYGLSLKVSYPNASDQLLKTNVKAGGLIYIHGGCTSIGCISMKNENAKELYEFSAKVSKLGSKKIPTRLTKFKLGLLKSQYAGNEQLLAFWDNLREGYDEFNISLLPLKYTIGETGKYEFKPADKVKTQSVSALFVSITAKKDVSLRCDSLMNHIVNYRFAAAQSMCSKKCVLDYFLYLNLPLISKYKIVSEKVGKEIAIVKVQFNDLPEMHELVYAKKANKWKLFFIKPQPDKRWIWYTCTPDDNLYIQLLDFDK